MRLLDPSATFRGEVDGVPFVARYITAREALDAMDAESSGADFVSQQLAVAAQLSKFLRRLGEKDNPVPDDILGMLTLRGLSSLFIAIVFAGGNDAGKSATP